jgi:serine phosphatase RsbU (regulator of sigma subunit)/anti-sigma regulatory factor (Ser/Thr protein kinase)
MKAPGACASTAIRLLPWTVLVLTAAVLLLVNPSSHYGLLLAVAPFTAAALYGVHATALLGAATVALYGILYLWLIEDTTESWPIKLGLIAAAAVVAFLTSQARERQRTLTRTRDAALALQQGLLPRQPRGTSAVEVCHRYVPTDVEAGVGGDWFDVIPLSGTRVALVIGDVVGHGLEAAALMGRLRTAVHTLADLDLAPDDLLGRMDGLAARLSADDEAQELSATCLYAVYDPVSGSCQMTSAGHPPPALRRPDGTVEFLSLPEHPPLGLGDTAFETTTIPLEPGTLIALCTDGLLNLRRQGADAALAALARVLASGGHSLPRLCDRLCRAAPADSDDDIAVLLARVTTIPAEHVASWHLPAQARAVSAAREAVAGQLDTWGLADRTFATELITSELVTNALRHASEPITLRLIRNRALICEVSDGSHTAPHVRQARPLDEGGRGLHLVAQLANRWGTRYTDTGKTIWAEQVLPVRAAGSDRTRLAPTASRWLP